MLKDLLIPQLYTRQKDHKDKLKLENNSKCRTSASVPRLI